MNHEIKKEDIIAYLYGELKGKEAESIKKYLEDNPKAAEEFKTLKNTRQHLKSLKNIEVSQPPVMILNPAAATKDKPNLTIGYWRKLGSVAAVFLIGLLLMKVLGVQMEIGDKRFMISFGASENDTIVSNDPIADQLAVGNSQQKMIDSLIVLLQKDNQAFDTKIGMLESQITLLSNKTVSNERLVNNASKFSDQNLEMLFKTITDQNMLMVNNIIASTNKTQQQYMNKMFADYSGFLEQQRRQDLNTIDVSLKTLQAEAAVKESQTKEIIAQLMQSINDKSN